MISKLIVGIIVAAIGTNVAMKAVVATGGSFVGFGWLAAGSAARTVTFLAKPFWADMEKPASTAVHNK